MANLIVAFDLTSASERAMQLRGQLGRMGFAIPLLDSVWYLKTTLSADQVREKLSPIFEFADRLLVIDAASATGWNIDAQHWHRLRDQWPR